jgi:hypothetical protein
MNQEIGHKKEIREMVETRTKVQYEQKIGNKGCRVEKDRYGWVITYKHTQESNWFGITINDRNHLIMLKNAIEYMLQEGGEIECK